MKAKFYSNSSEQNLFDIGDLRFLYDNRNNLPNWSVEELYVKLCSCKRGIEILHENMDYEGLIKGKAIDYMVEKKLWAVLAYYHIYDRVNWHELRSECLKYPNAPAVPRIGSGNSGKTVRMVYREGVAKANMYEFMAVDRIATSRLCRANFRLWVQSLSKKQRLALLSKFESNVSC